jgi:hypothetical protein
MIDGMSVVDGPLARGQHCYPEANYLTTAKREDLTSDLGAHLSGHQEVFTFGL